MRKIIALMIVGCLAFAAKVYWIDSSRISTDTPYAYEQQSKKPIQSKNENKLAHPLKHNWTVNEEIAYDMVWSIKQDSSVAPAGTRIEANWHFKVLEVENDKVLAVTRLNKVTIDDGAANDFGALTAMLEKEVIFVRYSRSGKLINIYWSNDLALKDSMTLKQINSVEVALPDTNKDTVPGSQWKYLEPSINGDAEILYTLLSKTSLSKETLRYNANNGQNMGFELEVDDSLYTVLLGNVWIDEYKGAETLTISNDQKVLTSVTSSVLLKRLPTLDNKLLSDLEANNFYEIRDKMLTSTLDPENVRVGAWDEVQQKKLSKSYQGIPLKQVVTDLIDAIKDAENHQQTVSATKELANWLQADGRNPEELVQLLRNQNFSSDETARMVHALELASSSPEAQVALGNLFADPTLPDLLREQALIAAGGVNPPAAPGLIDSLVNAAVYKDTGLGSTPLLNLGVLASTDKSAALALEQNFGSMLLPGLDIDSALLSTVIDAFTNSGLSSDVYKNSIQEILLTQESADLKVAAAEYLSAVAKVPAKNFLTTFSDSNTEVQIAGVKAMFRVSATEAANYSLAHANLESTSDRVRSEILSQLKDHKELSQQNATSIKAINNITDSESIHESIKELLSD